MNNAEKKESFDNYIKYKLFEAHKTAKADWHKDMTAEQVDNTMPYNASTGKTYSRETSMLLRAEMAIKGYDKAQFVTMEQGNAMGGTLKLKHNENGEIEMTKSGKQARVEGVKMLYIATEEIRPKFDSNGEKVMAQVIDPKTKKPKLDPKTKEPITYQVKERIPIKPRFETKTLYHVSQFDGLDTKKIKERDLTAVQNYREEAKSKPYEVNVDYSKTLGLGGNLANQLNSLTQAQIKGVDYFNPAQRIDITKNKKQTKAQDKGMER
nr:ArdC-like ssDNA-binding domain-containing protein [Candidatus Campylobacter infans]